MFIFLPANVIYLDSLQLCSQHSFQKGMTVKGIVTDTRKSPISGVVVTDGVHFTQTDEKDIIIFHPTSTNPSLCMCRYRQIINPQLRMHFLPDTMPDWINQKRQTDMISN